MIRYHEVWPELRDAAFDFCKARAILYDTARCHHDNVARLTEIPAAACPSSGCAGGTRCCIEPTRLVPHIPAIDRPIAAAARSRKRPFGVARRSP